MRVKAMSRRTMYMKGLFLTGQPGRDSCCHQCRVCLPKPLSILPLWDMSGVAWLFSWMPTADIRSIRVIDPRQHRSLFQGLIDGNFAVIAVQRQIGLSIDAKRQHAVHTSVLTAEQVFQHNAQPLQSMGTHR